MTKSPFRTALALVLSLALVAPPAFAQGADKAPDKKAEPKKETKEKPDKKKDAKPKDKKKEEPAEPPPPPGPAPLSETLTGEAKEAYDAAKILYSDGDYGGARIKFDRAYELSKDPRLLWNMAACEKNLRSYGKVLTLAQKYLAEGGDKLTEQDRKDAQALIDTVRGFVTDLTVNVNEAGAEIAVDGQKVAESPMTAPAVVDQGERKVSVSKPGFKTVNERKSLVGGGKLTMDVKLLPDLHEGRLRIVAALDDTIRVDGKVVGKGQWQGGLSSGAHTVTVSAPGKRTYQTDVVVQDDQLRTERVSLEAEPKAGPPERDRQQSPWPWIAGGAALAVGVGIGAYFLFRPKDDDSSRPRITGTIPPGYVPLRF